MSPKLYSVTGSPKATNAVTNDTLFTSSVYEGKPRETASLWLDLDWVLLASVSYFPVVSLFKLGMFGWMMVFWSWCWSRL